MDFRQLRQFVVLATELNYRKAAERLHMTQPPLSIAMKRLEEGIGVKLFERDRQGVRLTLAGGVFLGEAKRLLEGADTALLAARDADQGRIGTLRICAVPSASIDLLPSILATFVAEFPAIRLSLTSDSSVQILVRLQRGELDAALIVPPPTGVRGVDFVHLPRQPLMLAVPASHALADHATVRLGDLGDEPLVALAHSDSPGFAGEIMALCQRNGFHPRALQESSHALITLPLIAAGLGMAIVPKALSRVAMAGVAYVALTDNAGEALSYGMAVATPSQTANPAVPWFVATCTRVLTHPTAA